MNEKTEKLFIGQGVKIMVGNKPVGFAKSGMLTYQEEDDGTTKDSGAWENPMHHTYEVTGKGVVTDVGTPILELLNDMPSKVDVEIRRKLDKMPHKMKKAYRTGSRYRRDTKWKRKAKAYERRFIYRLPNAEMVVTRKQREMLEVVIRGSELQYNPVAYAGEKDTSKTLAAYVKRTNYYNANKHSLQRAESLDSLNVREMADVPELDIDKMEDKEVTERFYREWQQCGQKHN